MNEIKFACPHCTQHIACDPAYCDSPIHCPACGQWMFVPSLAAFGPAAQGAALRLPVASKTRVHPRRPALDLWTEQEWNRHLADATWQTPNVSGLLWALMLAPFPVALVLLALGARPAAVGACLLLFAVGCGFELSRGRSETRRGWIVGGCAGAMVVGFVFFVLAVQLLVRGCEGACPD